MKNIGAEVAEKLAAHFESPEFKSLIERTKAASDEDTGTFRVVGTSEHLDRYQEVIKLDGWDLEHYRKNPVILFGHDHTKLIGMATDIEVRDGMMIFTGKFAPTEEAQEKRRLYDLGFLKATSVGFIEKEREGNLITKAELLELSFVSVPANPFALSLAMEKGLSVNELVTKGIMFVERDAPEAEAEAEAEIAPVAAEETPDEPEAVEEPESPAEEPTEAQEASEAEQPTEERAFGPVIDQLKAAIVALEAVGQKAGEPEGDEAADEATDDATTEEERGLDEYIEGRRLIQEVVTVLGEVLADARQTLERKGVL